MSLRFKLFGVLGAALCVVLGMLVALALVQEQRRAAREQSLRNDFVEFAADLASPADLVPESALVRGGRLHVRVRALGIYPAPESGGRAEPDRAWGALREDEEVRRRAQELVEQAFRTGKPQRSGLAVAVPTRRAGEDAGTAGRVASVVYVELREWVAGDPGEFGRLAFLVVVGAGALLLVAIWILLDRVVERRLHQIVGAAGRVARGDYSTPVPETGRADEIERVVQAFNSMMFELARLQGRLRDQMGDVLAKARQTQDSLVIAQRLAATGRLAAGIAHEVNNPLAGMLNAVHALRTREMTPAKQQEYLELVGEGLQRIQATVAKILQFTPHKVAPRAATIDEVVRPVLALSRHRVEKEGVEVVVDERDGGARVFGDPYELQQAVLNVVINALDALEDADRESPRIEIRTWTDGDDVRLLVRDNGPGMKDEDLAKAFDLFFTTKDPGRGTGLGLAMAHKILSDHGGRILLRSRGREGLDVEFVLPRFRG